VGGVVSTRFVTGKVTVARSLPDNWVYGFIKTSSITPVASSAVVGSV